MRHYISNDPNIDPRLHTMGGNAQLQAQQGPSLPASFAFAPQLPPFTGPPGQHQPYGFGAPPSNYHQQGYGVPEGYAPSPQRVQSPSYAAVASPHYAPLHAPPNNGYPNYYQTPSGPYPPQYQVASNGPQHQASGSSHQHTNGCTRIMM